MNPRQTARALEIVLSSVRMYSTIDEWLRRQLAAERDAITRLPTLSSDGFEVLAQLFVSGPVWDGNIVSKAGRDDLVALGYAVRRHGWQTLTEAGLDYALSTSRDDNALETKRSRL